MGLQDKFSGVMRMEGVGGQHRVLENTTAYIEATSNCDGQTSEKDTYTSRCWQAGSLDWGVGRFKF